MCVKEYHRRQHEPRRLWVKQWKEGWRNRRRRVRKAGAAIERDVERHARARSGSSLEEGGRAKTRTPEPPTRRDPERKRGGE